MDDRHALIAAKLDGYLAAVAALKDDGSYFVLSHLGDMAPTAALPALCERLGLDTAGARLTRTSANTLAGIPRSFKHWCDTRVRNAAPDGSALDERLFEGFITELIDLLGHPCEWYELARGSSSAPPTMHLGAFCDIYVFGLGGFAYMVRCAWDD